MNVDTALLGHGDQMLALKIVAALRQHIQLAKLGSPIDGSLNLARAVDDDALLLVAARAIAQFDCGFDPGIVQASDLHANGRE